MAGTSFLLKYPIDAAFSCHEVWHSIPRSGTSTSPLAVAAFLGCAPTVSAPVRESSTSYPLHALTRRTASDIASDDPTIAMRQDATLFLGKTFFLASPAGAWPAAPAARRAGVFKRIW